MSEPTITFTKAGHDQATSQLYKVLCLCNVGMTASSDEHLSKLSAFDLETYFREVRDQISDALTELELSEVKVIQTAA